MPTAIRLQLALLLLVVEHPLFPLPLLQDLVLVFQLPPRGLAHVVLGASLGACEKDKSRYNALFSEIIILYIISK